MKVSLVVPTIGRSAPLVQLLESLRRQSFHDFEILLVDQNPPGYLDACLAPFKDLPMTRMRISPCGVSSARNAALPLVSGQVVGFPDDDCHYEPDTLSEVVRFFELDNGSGGFWASGGRPPSHSAKRGGRMRL